MSPLEKASWVLSRPLCFCVLIHSFVFKCHQTIKNPQFNCNKKNMFSLLKKKLSFPLLAPPTLRLFLGCTLVCNYCTPTYNPV